MVVSQDRSTELRILRRELRALSVPCIYSNREKSEEGREERKERSERRREKSEEGREERK